MLKNYRKTCLDIVANCSFVYKIVLEYHCKIRLFAVNYGKISVKFSLENIAITRNNSIQFLQIVFKGGHKLTSKVRRTTFSAGLHLLANPWHTLVVGL